MSSENEELKKEYGLTDEEIQTIGERYDALSEGGVLIVNIEDVPVPEVPPPVVPEVPLPPETESKKFTDFKYKFGMHTSKGKSRRRDTFYGKFAALNIQVESYLTVYGEEKENDEIDFKLGGGEHTDGKKARAGQCYAIGTHFDGTPFFAKEYPAHPKTPSFTDKVKIAEGAPKSLGNLRGKKFGMRVRKYVYENTKVKIECLIDLLNSKGWFLWFTVVDAGDCVGKPFTELNGEKYGSVELVYLRIDSITKKTETEGMYALDLGSVVPPVPEPNPEPEPEPVPPTPTPEPEPQPPTGAVDVNGIKMLHPVTGKFVEITEGNDHRNGQRYSKNHQFLNYMVIGYFKLGAGQDVMEHKTDGPNHGGCLKTPDCCWVEVNISLTNRKGYKPGQFYISSEHPHPKNFDAPKEGISDKIFNIKSKQWIGYCACAWQEGEFRHLQGWVDTNPFDSSGKPLNNWELGIDKIDKGQLTTPELAKRKIPIDKVKDKKKGMVGLESEIRMNNATNHDCEIKYARVYELIHPVT